MHRILSDASLEQSRSTAVGLWVKILCGTLLPTFTSTWNACFLECLLPFSCKMSLSYPAPLDMPGWR